MSSPDNLEFFNGLSKYKISLVQRMNDILPFEVESYSDDVKRTYCVYLNTVLDHIRQELVVEKNRSVFALKNGGVILYCNTGDYGGWFFVLNGEIKFFDEENLEFDEELECWMHAWESIKGENNNE